MLAGANAEPAICRGSVNVPLDGLQGGSQLSLLLSFVFCVLLSASVLLSFVFEICTVLGLR